MRIPRDISADDLSRALKQFGYLPTRQSGSHIRLTTTVNGEHHITIPNHRGLKIGTLAAILFDVASHLKISKEELSDKLFG